MAEDKATSRHAATQDHAAFTQSVKASLANAKEKAASIRRTDTQLFVTNAVSPAAATLIAALAAAIGGNELFKQAAAQSEDGGWKLACILVAVFGFIATVSSIFKKQFDDRLTLGNQCVGRLLTLDLAITTGSLGWEEAAKEYSEILKAFPEFIS
ncbi:MAG TPA: hypothetical protein VF896_17725 [Anaerolineales bacterium]